MEAAKAGLPERRTFLNWTAATLEAIGELGQDGDGQSAAA